MVGAIFGVIHALGVVSDVFLEKCGYFLLVRNFIMKFGVLLFKYQVFFFFFFLFFALDSFLTTTNTE